MARKIAAFFITSILAKYKDRIAALSSDSSIDLPLADLLLNLRSVTNKPSIVLTAAQQIKLFDLVWHSKPSKPGTLYTEIIRDLSKVLFNALDEDVVSLDVLKNPTLEVEPHQLYKITDSIYHVAKMMHSLNSPATLNNILFTKANYQQLLATLRDHIPESKHAFFLSRLTSILLLLTENNLLNQINFDLLLDNHLALINHPTMGLADIFYNREYGSNIDYPSGYPLTPHLLKVALIAMSQMSAHDQDHLPHILRMFLWSIRMDPSIAPDKYIEFILAHYKKIPDAISSRFYDIPQHLRTTRLFREFIKIADSDLSAQQKEIDMLELVNTTIRADGNLIAEGAINNNQSIHNQEVEHSVTLSVANLINAYPGAFTQGNFDTNLKALQAFTKSLKKSGQEKYAKATLNRLLANSADDSFKRNDMTIRQALVLAWVALHDESKYLPNVTLKSAKEHFIKAMVGIERAYNIDESERDNGKSSQSSCPGGTFNMVIGSLNTLHRDVEITFNSPEVAGYRLKAIIKAEIGKYLAKYPDLDLDSKNKFINEIPELYSAIELAFKSDTDNASYQDLLNSLYSLSINSILLAENAAPPPSAREDLQNDVVLMPGVLGFIKRTWRAIKSYLEKVFQHTHFNPFQYVYYNDYTEKNYSHHPLPHSRTLHTSLINKMLETILTLVGMLDRSRYDDDEYFMQPIFGTMFGILDYCTSLGLLKLAEVLLWRYITDDRSRHPKIAMIFYLAIGGLNTAMKCGLLWAISIVIAPIVALVHLASKVALAMQLKKANQIPLVDAFSGTTSFLHERFKENHLPEFSAHATSVFVGAHDPIALERKVQFSANGSQDYVTAKFSIKNRKHIDNARNIGRVNRQACQELNRAHLLSYRRAGA